MTDTETETVRVLVGWSDDYESAWVSGPPDMHEGDADGSDSMFEGDVPKALWDRFDSAHNEMDAAREAMIAHLGLDTESPFRMKEVCPRWEGHTTPGHHSYRLVLPAAADDSEWPRREVPVAYDPDQAMLERRRDGLPEEFKIIEQGSLLGGTVRRDQLVITEGGYAGWASRCHRCGWNRNEHTDPGGEVEL